MWLQDAGYADKIKDWWVTLTDKFRAKVTELTEEQKKYIQSSGDYSAPFTVDHILIEIPFAHLAIVSRYDMEKDKQITIHGPLKWKEVNPFLDNLIREPRWNRPLSKDLGPPRPAWASKSLAGSLATWLALDIRNLQGWALTEIEKAQFICHSRVTKKCTIMICVGNILEINAGDYATWDIENAKKWKTWVPTNEVQKEPDTAQAFTTTFFPPIVVESPPTWEKFESIVHKGFLSSWSDRILDTVFASFRLTAQRDGTLLVATDERKTARDIFNVIFAISALEGVTVFSVKESELGSARVDPKTLETRIYEGHKGVVFRNMILYNSFYRELGFSKGNRKLISKLQLMRIISLAERVFAKKNITELLLNWLQAKTLFENSEFSQAFVAAWINIEKDIFKILEEGKKGQKVHNIASTETRMEYPTFAYALKQLKHAKLLPSDRVDLLKNLNFHRNQFVHQGEEISKEVAYTSLSLLKLIVDEAMSDF